MKQNCTIEIVSVLTCEGIIFSRIYSFSTLLAKDITSALLHHIKILSCVDKWRNNALARNGTRWDLVACQYIVLNQIQAAQCSVEKGCKMWIHKSTGSL